MPKTLEFVFDPGGPNSYLAWKALPPILVRTGATLIYLCPAVTGRGSYRSSRPPSPTARVDVSPVPRSPPVAPNQEPCSFG